MISGCRQVRCTTRWTWRFARRSYRTGDISCYLICLSFMGFTLFSSTDGIKSTCIDPRPTYIYVPCSLAWTTPGWTLTSNLKMPNVRDDIKAQDEALLASLGYKQEFKRAFKPFEVLTSSSLFYNLVIDKWQVFGVAFSIIGLLPSIASVLLFALPNGGGPSMVWGVRWQKSAGFLNNLRGLNSGWLPAYF